METCAFQIPSRAFMHVAPTWAKALHALPMHFLNFRASHPSDDLMLTESDLDALAHPPFADEAESRAMNQRPR